MDFKRNCVWYDETKREGYHLCYHIVDEYDNPFIDECPKNCGNYICGDIKDEELREILQESAALAQNTKEKR